MINVILCLCLCLSCWLTCTNASHFLHRVVRVIRSRRNAAPGLPWSTAIDALAVISNSATADELNRAADTKKTFCRETIGWGIGEAGGGVLMFFMPYLLDY